MSTDPVQTLIARLKALNLSNRQIARAADLNESTIRRVFVVGGMNAKTLIALTDALPELERIAEHSREAA